MTELTRSLKKQHGITNKLTDYHKGKGLELQKIRDNLKSNKGAQGRSGPQPNSTPTCTFCNF